MIPDTAFIGWKPTEIEMFFANVRKGRHDIVFFMEYFLGMTAHDQQITWAQKATKIINILACGNKWGKTAFTAAKHIHKAFYKFGANGDPNEVERMEYQTLVISPVSSQSLRTQQYIEQLLTSSFSWDDPISGIRKTNKCKIQWFLKDVIRSDRANVTYLNGSRTDIRSVGDDKGSKIQGSDYYYISYDEYTRSHHLEEELEGNILPRLTVYGGDLDLIGTPDKDSPSLQYVYDLCEDAQREDSEYYFQGGSMYDNIFVSKKNKDRLVRGIRDKETLHQVIEGKMLFVGGRMFTGPVINNIWIKDAEWQEEESVDFSAHCEMSDLVLDLAGYVYKLPQIDSWGNKEGKYLIGMDWHLSDGGDETIIYVIRYDIMPHEICYYLATKRGNPFVKHDKVRSLHKIYGNASLVVDSQGNGGQLKYDLEDLEPTLFDSVSLGKEKRTMLSILKNFLYYEEDNRLVGKIKAPFIKELSRQLGVYKEDDKKLKQDHVMTLGVACWWIENNGVVSSISPDERY